MGISTTDIESGSSVISVDTKSGPRNLVLTYDDDPELRGTNAILKVLDDYKVTATFFVLLSRTTKNPSIIKDILSQGHEIALHGVNHKSLHEFKFQEIYLRTHEAKEELEEIIGRPVRWFRPPYGHQSAESWEAVMKAGLIPVVWSVECEDWKDATSADYEQYLKEVRGINNSGSIILAHDNFAEAMDGVRGEPRPHFNRGHLAKLILEIAAEKEFSCCSLENALKTGDPIWKQWFR